MSITDGGSKVHAAVVLLDFSKAFDKVPYGKLFSKLFKLDVDTSLVV